MIFKTPLLGRSTYKLERFLKLINNMDNETAISRLNTKFSPICKDILNLLKNVQNVHKVFFIESAWTGRGPYLKRYKPTSRGHTRRIRKPRSRVFIKINLDNSNNG